MRRCCFQEILRRYSSTPFDVSWAERLDKAIDRLRQEEFDAVLLDFTLPDSHGVATLDRLLDAAPWVPVIIMTGLEDENLAIRAIRQGAQDYLVKGAVEGKDISRAIQYAMDRKWAKERLAESEQRYRGLFSSMSEGFALHEILCDERGEPADCRFMDINPAFERMSGLKHEQVVGKRMLEVFPGTEPFWIQNYGRVALTGEPWHFESFSSVLGRWLDVYAYRPAEGQFAAVYTDVTEAVRVREREKEALATMTAARTAMDVLEAMGEGLAVADAKGIIRSANAAMQRLSGYADGEMIGTRLAKLLRAIVAPEDQAAALKALKHALQGQTVAVPPLTMVSRDGRRMDVIPAFSFIRGPNGRPTSIVLTVRDISELRLAHQALEESERKYRELVENANSIIMRRTADGRITFFNEFAQEFFGYTSQEIVGRNVLGTIVPEADSGGRPLAALIEEIGRHPEAHAANENENVCKDGRRVWVQWTNRALRDARGEVVEILCVGTDATERKRAEEERLRYQESLRSLARRLATTEEQERRRLSRLLHDTVIQDLSLSNIRLGAIRAEVGKAGLQEQADRLETVRTLLDGGIRQSRALMSDLAPPMLHELGLAPALEDLGERMGREHGVRVTVKSDSGTDALDQDLRGVLFQAARELMVNALKHAAPKLIAVSLRLDGGAVRVRVKDDGAGFDPPDASPHQGGIAGGFGLFSIRERLEGLGGRLEIESNPHRGTVATIIVPLGQGGGETPSA